MVLSSFWTFRVQQVLLPHGMFSTNQSVNLYLQFFIFHLFILCLRRQKAWSSQSRYEFIACPRLQVIPSMETNLQLMFNYFFSYFFQLFYQYSLITFCLFFFKICVLYKASPNESQMKFDFLRVKKLGKLHHKKLVQKYGEILFTTLGSEYQCSMVPP